MGVILVVDDHDDTRRLLIKLLQSQGHVASGAASGEEAIGAMAKSVPDLVILDNMMPGMNGTEVLRLARSDPRTARVPIVMYSAVSDSAFAKHTMDKGANDYWVKGSMDFASLAERVEKLLNPPQAMAQARQVMERVVGVLQSALGMKAAAAA